MAETRILYVITDLELGGVPLHLLRLAQAMQSRGFQVAAACLARPGIVSGMLSERGITTYACNGCCGLDYRVVPRLSAIIEEFKPALIHSLLFHANQAVRLAGMLLGFPREKIICELQTVEVERRWHLWVDRFTHRFCRLTVGNSRSVIGHLHHKAGIPLDRLRLVRGGVDADRIRLAPAIDRSALGLAANDRMLLWVGRLDPVKGLDQLLLAMPALVAAFSAKLFLVGEGPEKDRLTRMVRELSLESHVIFAGPRLDVPSLLRVANAFVFPSRTEGLPNALLEAMAAGAPIVATDVPGCRDLVTNEKSGLLVPYGGTIALAHAIKRILSDNSLASRLGAQARTEAAAAWHIDLTWASYASVYQEAMDEASTPAL